MSDSPASTVETVRGLLTAAGLPIDEDRLSRIAAEYAAQLVLVDQVVAAAEGPGHATDQPYDPTFPALDAEESSR